MGNNKTFELKNRILFENLKQEDEPFDHISNFFGSRYQEDSLGISPIFRVDKCEGTEKLFAGCYFIFTISNLTIGEEVLDKWVVMQGDYYSVLAAFRASSILVWRAYLGNNSNLYFRKGVLSKVLINKLNPDNPTYIELESFMSEIHHYTQEDLEYGTIYAREFCNNLDDPVEGIWPVGMFNLKAEEILENIPDIEKIEKEAERILADHQLFNDKIFNEDDEEIELYNSAEVYDDIKEEEIKMTPEEAIGIRLTDEEKYVRLKIVTKIRNLNNPYYTYSELNIDAGLGLSPNMLSYRGRLATILNNISRAEVMAYARPMLSSFVTTQSTSKPGQGYYDLAQELYPEEYIDYNFERKERNRAIQFWRSPVGLAQIKIWKNELKEALS